MDPLQRVGWGLGSCREKGKRVVWPEQEEWPCLGIARDSEEGGTVPSILAGVFRLVYVSVCRCLFHCSTQFSSTNSE